MDEQVLYQETGTQTFLIGCPSDACHMHLGSQRILLASEWSGSDPIPSNLQCPAATALNLGNGNLRMGSQPAKFIVCAYKGRQISEFICNVEKQNVLAGFF